MLTKQLKGKVLVVLLSLLVAGSVFSYISNASNLSDSQTNNSVVPYALPAGYYYLNFTATGLPVNTTWYIFIGTSPGYYNYYNTTKSRVNSFQETNGSYYITSIGVPGYSYSVTPSTGTVILHGQNVNVNLAFTNITTSPTKQYNRYFNITNLPTVILGVNWQWSVDLLQQGIVVYASTTSLNATAEITNVAAGTYNFEFNVPFDTQLTPTYGTVSVASNGTTFIKFTQLPKYKVTFVEFGLASGKSFGVTISSTEGSYSPSNSSFPNYNYVSFELPNGTYQYSINPPSGYTSLLTSGSILVNDSSLTINVTFISPASTYNLTFRVVNLPANIPNGYWYFEVFLYGNGNSYSITSETTYVEFHALVDGNYYYSVDNGGTGTPSVGSTLSPSSGSVQINGTNELINLTLLPPVPTYYANFTITSFPPDVSAGIGWTVEIANSTGYYIPPYHTNSYEILVPDLSPGTYYYYLSADSPYAFKSSQGTFTIKDSNVTVSLSMIIAMHYLVSISETGLLPGTEWGIVFDSGFVYNDTFTGYLPYEYVSVPILTFLPNGTYYYQAYVYANNQYYFQQPVQVVVNGKQVSQSVSFSPTTSSPTGSATLTTALIYTGIAVAGAVIGGLVAYAIVRRRRVPPKIT